MVNDGSMFKLGLTFESVHEILKCDHLVKASEQYFPVVFFVMLHKVIQTFESVDEILMCDYSNETSSGVCSHGAFQFFLILQLEIWIFFRILI